MIEEKMIGLIILNYKDAQTTIRLLRQIGGYVSIDHIVVVDNLSPDDSFEQLKKMANDKIDVIQSDRNGGYSYGNNFGAFFLMNKYHLDILFIANPDVEFTENFLIRIVHDMNQNLAQAASGYMKMPENAYPVVRNPRINTFWREVLDCTCILKHIFPFRGDVLRQGTGIQQVEWIPGSLFAIDSSVYKKIGGLDDNVFLFYEEQILGKIFLDHGYNMIIDTDITYFHNHSVSINKSIKRYDQVKQLFKSKYYFYTRYAHISFVKRLFLACLIVYGLIARKILYKFML